MGLMFGVFGMIGVFVGGLFVKFILGGVLLVLFVVLMFVMSVVMFKGKKKS